RLPEAGEPAGMAGRRVGPYRLLREVGQGGMGVVYEAVRDDDQFEKRVAVKLIRWGAATDRVLRRFRRERQILAGLDHPNICTLFDGGVTAEGLPYFVMEYVDGVPLDVHCDRHHLTLRQRLELFTTVCSAVQYAHRRLVVHRDPKPSNILVAADGTVKLVDFGIATLLREDHADPRATLTGAGWEALTPDYASPEQLAGRQVSTASDVYSL